MKMAPFDIAYLPNYDFALLRRPSLQPSTDGRADQDLAPVLVSASNRVLTPVPKPGVPTLPPVDLAGPEDECLEISGVPTIWRRARWTENLLQLVDKDAAVTAVVFICFYVGVLQAL